MAVLDKGDEAILPSPYWVSYEEMIKLAEAVPVFCETGEKFKLTAEQVERRISGKTRMLILNSPCNPTGAVFEPSEIAKIAKLAVDNKFYVVSRSEEHTSELQS